MDITVYPATALAYFVDLIFRTGNRPTEIIVCVERAAFIASLVESIRNAVPASTTHDAAQDEERGPNDNVSSHRYLLGRTLRLLASARFVHLTFCPSVPALHAHLSTLPVSTGTLQRPDSATSRHRIPTEMHSIILLNILALHREAGSLSAQGLGTTIASAVEAGCRCAAKVSFFEALIEPMRASPSEFDSTTVRAGDQDDLAMEPVVEQVLTEEESAIRTGLEGQNGEAHDYDRAPTDPWDEEVPVLSTTSRTFGTSGTHGGGWVGKRVKVRDVVGRWARVQDAHDPL